MRFVPIQNVKPGMVLGRPIKNSSRSVMLGWGVELTEIYIQKIKEQGYAGLYIEDEFSKDIQIAETISPETFERGVDAVKNVNVDELVNAAKSIVAEILDTENLVPNLTDLRSYDDYTYHHSVNVAVYATIIAKQMGLRWQDVELVGIAGICHDLGKTQIDEAILNKPGKLTDEEFAEIKKHSRFSFDLLEDNYKISAKVRQAVLYHHENENGTGYPDGKQGKDIPLFSKIIHVADVYDALTSKRPYKDPYSPAEAMEYIMGGANILFDSQVVAATLESVPAYPAGIEVLLSNGETGVVVRKSKMPLRPVIRLTKTGEDIDLSENYDYLGVTIADCNINNLNFSEELGIAAYETVGAKTRPRILIVDDMITSLMAIKDALQDEYQLVLLKSGYQVLEYLKKNDKPDLLLLDVDMPYMDGTATLKKVRETVGMEIPVIFITALADASIVIKCKQLGALDYILKPVNGVYLRERVSMVLQNRVDS